MILVVSTAVAAGSTVPIYHLAGESVGVALGVWCLPGAVAAVAWLPQLSLRSQAPRQAAGAGVARIWQDPLARRLTVFVACQWLLFYAPFSWLAPEYRPSGLRACRAGGAVVG